jgi:hypothetical protein
VNSLELIEFECEPARIGGQAASSAADRAKSRLFGAETRPVRAAIAAMPGWNGRRPRRALVRPSPACKNWRVTFRIGRYEIEIVDLDYEDYHQA